MNILTFESGIAVKKIEEIDYKNESAFLLAKLKNLSFINTSSALFYEISLTCPNSSEN